MAMLVDGAATCAIIQDASRVTNLRPANIQIQVGGGVLTCSLIGDFTYYQPMSDGYVINKVEARILPNFGVDIIPEALYLEAGCRVSKFKSLLTAVHAESDQTLLSATKLKHSWLYYATVTPIKPPEPPLPLLRLLPYKHLQKEAPVDAGEISTAATLALGFPAINHLLASEVVLLCNAVFDRAYPARSQSFGDDDLLTEHIKLGHPNWRDTCAILGVKLPAKLPVCLACIKSKSKRFPLTARDTPLYDAPQEIV